MTQTASSIRSALDRCWTAQAAYIASERLDFGPMEATLHPEIVLYQANSLPYGGEWRGRDGIRGWLQAMDHAWNSVEVRDARIVEADGMVVVTASFVARARASGATVAMPICELIRFRDSLPIEWRVFYLDTAQINEALGHMARRRHSSGQ